MRDGSIGRGLDVKLLKSVEAIGIASPALLAEFENAPEEMPWLWHDEMDLKLKLMRSSGMDVERLKQAPIGSPNLLLEAVRGGIGATFFTESLAQHEIEAGRVVQVDTPKPIAVDYVAVTPKGPPHPLAMPFADWVKTLL